jgi:alkaline phosphatase D
VETREESDFTGQVLLSGLREATTHYLRVLIEDRVAQAPPYPSFRTFPGSAASVTVGLLTDLAAGARSRAFASLARDEPDLVVILGDYPHADPAGLEAMRAMHRDLIAGDTAVGLSFRDSILWRFPVARVWDDHDYGWNNSDKTFPHRRESLAAFDEYWPGYERPAPHEGLWHAFRYGDLVEVFVLDLRSQRDPVYGAPPDDPDKSMLDGDERPEGRPKGQKAWLLSALRRSRARWKLIVSSVPWNRTVEKDDSWWAYRAEQRQILDALRAGGVEGVVVVSGDIHVGGAIDDGSLGGLPELSVPTTNSSPGFDTCSARVPFPHGDLQPVSCGRWSHGYRQAGSGYGLVTATRDRLRLEARGQDGSTVLSLDLR